MMGSKTMKKLKGFDAYSFDKSLITVQWRQQTRLLLLRMMWRYSVYWIDFYRIAISQSYWSFLKSDCKRVTKSHWVTFTQSPWVIRYQTLRPLRCREVSLLKLPADAFYQYFCDLPQTGLERMTVNSLKQTKVVGCANQSIAMSCDDPNWKSFDDDYGCTLLWQF